MGPMRPFLPVFSLLFLKLLDHLCYLFAYVVYNINGLRLPAVSDPRAAACEAGQHPGPLVRVGAGERPTALRATLPAAAQVAGP